MRGPVRRALSAGYQGLQMQVSGSRTTLLARFEGEETDCVLFWLDRWDFLRLALDIIQLTVRTKLRERCAALRSRSKT